MGHPWKRPRTKPGMTDREYWGELYPFFADGTVAKLMEVGKQRRRISRTKQNCLALQEKNRLLKRKISDFNTPGGKNGKNKEF
jgi:hypothetical protein